MRVAVAAGRCVGGSPVGHDRRAGLDHLAHERQETLGGDILDVLQADAAEALGLLTSTAIATIDFVAVWRPRTPGSSPPT